MSQFIVSCCSTVDLPRAYLEERDIPFLCFSFQIDGVEYPDDLGVTMPLDEFYGRIAAGAMPTTSQINTQRYIEFFEPFLQSERDVLHIALSSGLSGSFQSATLAAEELREKYPERRLSVIDSLCASSGSGLMVAEAADLRDRGETIDAASQWILDNRQRFNAWFFTTDLSHFKRGGRVSATAATFGKLLEICPLMCVDREGRLRVTGKVRGKEKVMAEAVNLMAQRADGREQYSERCFVSHSNCREMGAAAVEKIESRFPALRGNVMLNDIGTVIGSHTGQGTVAIFYLGQERDV